MPIRRKPLRTYIQIVAVTKSGAIGIKVWIFKGELGPRETTAGLLPVRGAAERAV